MGALQGASSSAQQAASGPSGASSASPRLRRQRSFAAAISSMSLRCCLCGKNSLCDLDFDTFLCRFPHSSPKDNGSPSSPQKLHPSQAWWHDSWRLLGSRRRTNPSTVTTMATTGSSGWGEDALMVIDEDQPYLKPPRWKLLFRKLRAETRKMNCSRPAPPGFHYDSLSYAMNFDDGSWQQQGNHPSRFSSGSISGPVLTESSSFKESAS